MANDLYIVATPFHLLYSCTRATEGDWLVIIQGFKISNELKKIIEYKFASNFVLTSGFYYYRSNIKNLLKFRRDMRDISNELKCNSTRNIVSFNDVDPVSQWIMANIKHTGKCYIIEEGIGLYRDTKKRHEQIFQYVGKILFGYSFQNVKRIGECIYTDGIICKDAEKLSPIQKSKIVIQMEKNDFSNLADKLKIKRIYKKAWFIGQPLVEDGVLSIEEYIGLIQLLIDKDCLNNNIMIKPHPRENIDKYLQLEREMNISICMANEIPAELLIDNSKETKIYTLYSSAVRNFSNTKNLSVEVLYKLLPKISGISDSLFDLKGINIRSEW